MVVAAHVEFGHFDELVIHCVIKLAAVGSPVVVLPRASHQEEMLCKGSSSMAVPRVHHVGFALESVAFREARNDLAAVEHAVRHLVEVATAKQKSANV